MAFYLQKKIERNQFCNIWIITQRLVQKMLKIEKWYNCKTSSSYIKIHGPRPLDPSTHVFCRPEACNFIKKELFSHRCFPANFVKFLRTSGGCLLLIGFKICLNNSSIYLIMSRCLNVSEHVWICLNLPEWLLFYISGASPRKFLWEGGGGCL